MAKDKYYWADPDYWRADAPQQAGPECFAVADQDAPEDDTFKVDIMFLPKRQGWFWAIWRTHVIGATLVRGLSPTRAAARADALAALNSGQAAAAMKRIALADLEW